MQAGSTNALVGCDWTLFSNMKFVFAKKNKTSLLNLLCRLVGRGECKKTRILFLLELEARRKELSVLARGKRAVGRWWARPCLCCTLLWLAADGDPSFFYSALTYDLQFFFSLSDRREREGGGEARRVVIVSCRSSAGRRHQSILPPLGNNQVRVLSCVSLLQPFKAPTSKLLSPPKNPRPILTRIYGCYLDISKINKSRPSRRYPQMNTTILFGNFRQSTSHGRALATLEATAYNAVRTMVWLLI
ncbi:hypothetical protein V8F06_004328 [Rhypophila decipiens]